MRIAFLIIFSLWQTASGAGVVQKIEHTDRDGLRRAEKVADIFVERFRQTLDFGVAWRELRARQFDCRLIKSDLVTSVSDEKKAEIGTFLLERAYVALMNYYYLKSAHDLSVVRMDSGKTGEQITSKEILDAEKASVYSRADGESPENAEEIRAYIVELDRLAKLYRKHMPRDVMRSAVWEANYKYLTDRGGVTHLGVNSGHLEFCIPENIRYYVVDRGVFYFYMVEEGGKMKIIELGVGN